jgi:hypothetical protein
MPSTATTHPRTVFPLLSSDPYILECHFTSLVHNPDANGSGNFDYDEASEFDFDAVSDDMSRHGLH